MALTYKCPVCNKTIKEPKAEAYTCGREYCQKIWKAVQKKSNYKLPKQAMEKIINIKD